MILDFLRGARPNPGAPFRLLHRHAEGGRWREVGRASDRAGAEDEVRAGWTGWRDVDPAPGDLASLRQGRLFVGDYGLAPSGALVALPSPLLAWTQREEDTVFAGDQRTWPAAWEASTSARAMLWAARVAVPRRARVGATAACVRLAARYVPADPAHASARVAVAAMLAAAEGWRPGEYLPAAAATLALEEARLGPLSPAAREVVAAAGELSAGALAGDPHQTAYRLSEVPAALLRAFDEGDGLPDPAGPRRAAFERALAGAVRRRIPLAEVVLGLLDGAAVRADP